MDACFGLLHFLLFEKQLDNVRLQLLFFAPLCTFIHLPLLCFHCTQLPPQESKGAYLCSFDPDLYLSRDLRRMLQPLGSSQVHQALCDACD